MIRARRVILALILAGLGFSGYLQGTGIAAGAIQAPVCEKIIACPAEVSPGEVVRLYAIAFVPNENAQYRWTVTNEREEAVSGRIDGDGPEVAFQTLGLPDGPYRITLQIFSKKENPPASCHCFVTLRSR